MSEIIQAPAMTPPTPERLANRAHVMRLQEALLALPKEHHVDPPVVHYFAGGVYAREMTAVKGTVAVGKILKVATISTISAGEVSIFTEQGLLRVKAPFTWVAPAGTKRAAYFHEDTVWTVYHVVGDLTDVDAIEQQVVAESFDDPVLTAAELIALVDGEE